jgi:hypothetical protein
MKIILKKSDWLTDWYVIERAEHDGRQWLEETGPHSSRFMLSSRIVPSYCVEGPSGEMIELARCILNKEDCSFNRCAVAFKRNKVQIWSPRNYSGSPKGVVTLKEATDFANSVLEILVPKKVEEEML